MKAMVIRRFGGPEVLELAEMPMPRPGAGKLLVKVAASSVNPIDLKIRSGAVPALAGELPLVPHGDVAGVVVETGPGVTRFKNGDEVYACAGGIWGIPGALAEFMVVDEAGLARKPDGLSLRDAAALPLVALTAYEAVVDRASIEPGQKVLVHGATGGVGHLALQLAKLRGAMVHTTVSSQEKAQIAFNLGADVVIFYHEQTVADYVKQHTAGTGFDAVVDTVGGDTLRASFQAVRAGGTVVTIAARSTQDLSPLHASGASLQAVFMILPLLRGVGRERQGEVLARIARLVDLGRIEPLLDPEVFTFAQAGGAHARLESGKAVGKIRLEAGW